MSEDGRPDAGGGEGVDAEHRTGGTAARDDEVDVGHLGREVAPTPAATGRPRAAANVPARPEAE